MKQKMQKKYETKITNKKEMKIFLLTYCSRLVDACINLIALLILLSITYNTAAINRNDALFEAEESLSHSSNCNIAISCFEESDITVANSLTARSADKNSQENK